MNNTEKASIRKIVEEEAKKVKVHKAEGKYNFDNPDLEHQTKR